MQTVGVGLQAVNTILKAANGESNGGTTYHPSAAGDSGGDSGGTTERLDLVFGDCFKS
jgi:hypothetical protein